MKTTNADTFRLSVNDGRVVLEFGETAGASPAKGRTTVTVSEGIAVEPDIARRLLSGLNAVLARRPASAPPSRPGTSGDIPANAAPDEAGLKAAQLFRLVGSLGAAYDHERSLRMSPGRLQANRFLLSISARSLAPEAASRVETLLHGLGMPGVLVPQALSRLSSAAFVHFGFEEDEGAILYKLYLESELPPDAAKARAPFLLHLAFKWSALDPSRHVQTEYFLHPNIPASEIGTAMSRLYQGIDAPHSLGASREILDMVVRHSGPGAVQFLEVREQDSPRISFDLNLYDAGLRVKDFQPVLARLREAYAIRPGQFQALYDQIKARRAGHIAGGVHRNGAEFFSLYYGDDVR